MSPASEKATRSKRLAFTATMATATFLMQLLVPGIPLGWTGKLELADLPAILAAAFGGTTSGITAGFFFGLGSPSAAALIPTAMCTYGFLGFMAKKTRMSWVSIPVAKMVVGAVVGAVLYKLVYFWNSPVTIEAIIGLGLTYATPGTLISIPLYLYLKRTVHWLTTL